jgi:hypothetical protein
VSTTYFGVDVADIESRWRALGAEETTVATVLLQDADTKLNNARPMLSAAIALAPTDAHYVDPRLAVMCVVDMVWRVLINPDMFRTTTVGADGAVGAGYFSTEILRARLALAAGDLDEIDRALRVTGQGYSVVASRRMLNVDYGRASTSSTLPTP